MGISRIAMIMSERMNTNAHKPVRRIMAPFKPLRSVLLLDQLTLVSKPKRYCPLQCPVRLHLPERQLGVLSYLFLKYRSSRFRPLQTTSLVLPQVYCDTTLALVCLCSSNPSQECKSIGGLRSYCATRRHCLGLSSDLEHQNGCLVL